MTTIPCGFRITGNQFLCSQKELLKKTGKIYKNCQCFPADGLLDPILFCIILMEIYSLVLKV